MNESKKSRYGYNFPLDWNYSLISNLCHKIYTGGTPYRKNKEFWKNGEIPWIKSGEVRNSVILVTGEKINRLGLDNSAAKYYPPKTVLFALYGQGPTAGRVAYIENKMTSNQAVLGLILNHNKLNYKYLFYYFQLIYKRIRAQRYSGAQPNFNASFVKNIKIYYPTLLEQQKIVSIFSNVDAIIQTTQQLIDQMQLLKKGLMQQLFTEGISHTEFKETKLGRIPKKWDVIKLGEFSIFKNGINFNKEQKGEEGILTVDVKNMYNSGISIDFSNLYRVKKDVNSSYLLKDGDILFVRSSLKQEGVGWPSLVKIHSNEPVSFCGFLIRARIKKGFEINPKFLLYFLRYPLTRKRLINYSGQVAITNISQDSLKILPIILPDISEQNRISNILYNIDREINNEMNYQETLKDLKKGLMQQLLTGKKKIPMN